MNVFVLEDAPERIDWFKKTFANDNIDITDSVDSSIKKLSHNTYDLIFLDRDLGKLKETGEDLAWSMLENKMAKETPVIVHSMNSRGQRVIQKYLKKYKKDVYSIRFNDLKKYSLQSILKIAKLENTEDIKEVTESQSIIDFVVKNVHQLKGTRAVDASNKIKAAESLYQIWKNTSNQVGNDVYQKPENINFDDLSQMQDEGLVKIIARNRFKITSEGSTYLKTMILGDNRNSFSKNNDKKLEYRTAEKNTEASKTSSWINKIVK